MPGATPAVNDYLEIRTCCYTTDQISLNVLCYQVIGVTGTALTCQIAAFNFDTAVRAVYKSWMSADASWRGVGVRNLQNPRTVEFSDVSFAGPGTAVGKNLPTQVSGLISTKTGLAGRNMRGRIYPGLPSDTWADINGSLTGPGSAALAAISAAIGPVITLNTGIGTLSLELQVRHPDGLGPIFPPFGTPVTVMRAGVRFATQRRRGQFGRPNVLPF